MSYTSVAALSVAPGAIRIELPAVDGFGHCVRGTSIMDLTEARSFLMQLQDAIGLSSKELGGAKKVKRLTKASQ